MVETGANGSVTLLSGGPLTITQNGRDQVIRRPGFTASLRSERLLRRTREQLAAAVDGFAPVENVTQAAPTSTQTAYNAALSYTPLSSTLQTSQTSETQTSGTQNPGSQTSGTQTFGTLTSGTLTSGNETSGNQTSGTPTSGAPTSGPQTPVQSIAPVQASTAPTSGPQTPVPSFAPVQAPEAPPPAQQPNVTPIVPVIFAQAVPTSSFIPGDDTGFGVAAPLLSTGSTDRGGCTDPPCPPPAPPTALDLDGQIQAVLASGDLQGDILRYHPTGASGLMLDFGTSPIVNFVTETTVSLFVIDGVQDSTGVRSFSVGGIPVTSVLGSALPGMGATGAVTRYAITNGLGANGGNQPVGLSQGATVTAQYPGATAFTQATSFGPGQAILANAGSSPPLADTGLLVISDPAHNNPVLRSELQIASNGTSAATITVGGLYPASGSANVSLTASLVGSVQPTTSGVPTFYSASLGSPGYSLNTLSNLNQTLTSQVPVQAVFGSPGTAIEAFAVQQTAAAPVITVGASGAPQTFAGYNTLLATNVGAAPAEPVGPLNLTGYASAIVTSVVGGQISLYSVGTASNGVSIISQPNSAVFSATMNFQATGIGALAGQGVSPPTGITAPSTPLSFGTSAPNYSSGAAPTTAVASQATFAAVGPGAAMASVNQTMLNTLASGLPAAANLPASNQHVAWGYFLGDLANQANAGSGNYTNLGFWVAGQQVPMGTLKTLAGSATYTGGMIGTAVDGVAKTVAVRVGSFTQTWNFQNGSSTVNNFTFDGGSWSNLPLTAGATSYSGSAASGGRILSINGVFFNNPANSRVAPAATGGAFGILSTSAPYGANGIFVGTKR